jgi:hypothetical protein
MTDKFFLNFQDSRILSQGYKIQKSEATQNCYNYVLKENPDNSLKNVQLEPVSYNQKKWLFGPATSLSSRSIIYPCRRYRCALPCPCLICRKKHPTCRVPSSQGCNCQNCRMHFIDHSYHVVYHHGCRYCHQIVKILPNCNFYFLNMRKRNSLATPYFSLPPGQKLQLGFLSDWKWTEKLSNRMCDIEDDGIWCNGCNTLFWTVDLLRNHLLTNHNHGKSFPHKYISDYKEAQFEFKCCQCTSTYASRRDLQRHIDSLHHKLNLACDECDSTFTRMDNYERHRVTKHPKDENQSSVLECKQCGKTFTRISDLVRHTIKSCNSSGISSFQCQPCARTFKQKSALERHFCEEWDNTFPRKDNYKRRRVTKHPKDENQTSVLECKQCDKTFTRKSDLNRHTIQSCNSSGISTFQCQFCATTFKRKSDLERHFKASLNTDHSPKYICDRCGKKLCNRKMFIVHCKTQHGNVDGAFKCYKCMTSFVTDSDLKVHKSAHFPVSYKCEYCKTSFVNKDNLKRHSSILKVAKYGCKECDNVFCSGNLLRQHEDAAHGTFCCSVCGQSFALRFGLEYHVKKSSQITCNDCGKIFCNQRSLNDHMILNHGNL